MLRYKTLCIYIYITLLFGWEFQLKFEVRGHEGTFKGTIDQTTNGLGRDLGKGKNFNHQNVTYDIVK